MYMVSFAAESAAVSTHSQGLFSRSWTELSFPLIRAVEIRTRKENRYGAIDVKRAHYYRVWNRKYPKWMRRKWRRMEWMEWLSKWYNKLCSKTRQIKWNTTKVYYLQLSISEIIYYKEMFRHKQWSRKIKKEPLKDFLAKQQGIYFLPAFLSISTTNKASMIIWIHFFEKWKARYLKKWNNTIIKHCQ